MTKTIKSHIYAVVGAKRKLLGVFTNQSKALDFAKSGNAKVEMWDAQQNECVAIMNAPKA